MATTFPTALDSLTNPLSTDSISSPSHASQHANVNDSIEALQAKVGINGSSDPLSLQYRITDLESISYVTTDNLSNTLEDYVPIGDVGQIDGVASLDSTGNIPISQLGNLIDGAPNALNTLNELAAALADDSDYATTVASSLLLKAPLASPTFTGTVSGITSAMVGLGNVNNTSDANKPVSTATQTALNLKSNLASPTFTGTVNLSSATVTGVISVIQQNGVALTKRPAMNFLGGALVEDDLVNNRINVTITGGIPELIDGGNFDSVCPYDGGAPDAVTFENIFDSGEEAA